MLGDPGGSTKPSRWEMAKRTITTTESTERPQKLNTPSENNFTTSPPATGGDSQLAADLIADAAFAMSTPDQESARTESESRSRSQLGHAHHDVRVAAIAALARVDAFTAADLKFSLSDSSSLVRRRAVEAAAQLIQSDRGDSVLATALIKALDDDRSVTEAAAFALGEFGPEAEQITEPAIGALVRLAADHTDPLCRESAVAALGALHQGRATILAALGDKATVRRRAVLALAPFDGDDVDAALSAALDDRDWQVRQAAEDQQAARE